MLYQINERVRTAHDFFKLAFFHLLSTESYRAGDMLYWYISNHSSQSTEIAEDYFVLEINKKDLANDLGYRDETYFRKRTKQRKGLTLWEELSQIGFRFKNGYHVSKQTAKRTIIHIPLVFESLDWKHVHFPSYFEVRRTKFLESLQSLQVKMCQLSSEKKLLKWHEIDYSANSINTFRIIDFTFASEKKIRALLLRQFCCLVAHAGFTIGKDIEHEQLFKTFNSLVNYGNCDYAEIQAIFIKVSKQDLPNDLQKLYGIIRGEFRNFVSKVRAKNLHEQEPDKWDMVNERFYRKQVALLRKKLKNNPDRSLEILEKEYSEYRIDANNIWLADKDGRFGEYLFHELCEARNREKQRQLAEEAFQEQELRKHEYEELFCNNDRDDLDWMLTEV